VEGWSTGEKVELEWSWAHYHCFFVFMFVLSVSLSHVGYKYDRRSWTRADRSFILLSSAGLSFISGSLWRVLVTLIDLAIEDPLPSVIALYISINVKPFLLVCANQNIFVHAQ